VLRSTSHSLDIPFADAFTIIERWVVEELDDNRVRIRIHCDVVFSRLPYAIIASQIRKSCQVQIPKTLGAWKDKAVGLTSNNNVVPTIVIEPLVPGARGRDWNQMGRVAVGVGISMWMLAVIVMLVRLTSAVEEVLGLLRQRGEFV
jgi:hypothetical protein